MNKKYITPEVEVYNVENTSILDFSNGDNAIGDGTITDPNKIASKEAVFFDFIYVDSEEE